MDLNSLPKVTEKGKKRLGRGYGSGRGGHASSRGNKGQLARGKVSLFFEGTKTKKSLIKRLPLVRGKGKLKSFRDEPLVINLKYLNLFKKDEEVNLFSLKEKGILPKDLPQDIKIKILGDGEINIPLLIAFPCSKSAKEKIEKAGGSLIALKKIVQKEAETPKVKEVPKEKAKKEIKEEKKPTEKTTKKAEVK